MFFVLFIVSEFQSTPNRNEGAPWTLVLAYRGCEAGGPDPSFSFQTTTRVPPGPSHLGTGD